MARSIGMRIEKPAPVYRAVILYLYPGLSKGDPKIYTDANGVEYKYHSVSAYGPYDTKAPATSQITSAIRDHERYVKDGHYLTRRVWNSQLGRSEDQPTGHGVPSLTGFVEEQVPAWTQLANSLREA